MDSLIKILDFAKTEPLATIVYALGIIGAAVAALIIKYRKKKNS